VFSVGLNVRPLVLGQRTIMLVSSFPVTLCPPRQRYKRPTADVEAILYETATLDGDAVVAMYKRLDTTYNLFDASGDTIPLVPPTGFAGTW